MKPLENFFTKQIQKHIKNKKILILEANQTKYASKTPAEDTKQQYFVNSEISKLNIDSLVFQQVLYEDLCGFHMLLE
jgi:hypothetical protein